MHGHDPQSEHEFNAGVFPLAAGVALGYVSGLDSVLPDGVTTVLFVLSAVLVVIGIVNLARWYDV